MFAVYIAALVLLFTGHSLNDSWCHQSIGVNALTLDSRTRQLQEEDSVTIHGIARQRLCSDGGMAKPQNIQVDGELTTYELRCDDAPRRNTTMDAGDLHKRQVTTLCTDTCNHDCFNLTFDFYADPNDCAEISTLLTARNTRWELGPNVTNVFQLRTCMYLFTNKLENTLNFCDSAWGSIGDSIASYCGRTAPTKGGICGKGSFYVQAIGSQNQNVKELTATLTSSTSTFSSPSSSSSSSSSPSPSPWQSSESTNVTGTTNSTVPPQSTISFETPHEPTDGVAAINGPASQSSNAPPSSDVQPPDTGRAGRTNTAAIVGGTFGGVAAVAFLFAIFFIVRRREEIRTEKGYRYVSSPFIMSTRPTSISSNPAVSRDLIDVQDDEGTFSRKSVMAMPATPSLWPLSVRREQPTVPAAQGPTDRSGRTKALSNERSSSEDSAPRDAAVPAPTVTVEALIAAAAPREMSQEQVNLFAANFVSLMRGHQPLGEGSREEGGADETQSPPPYQQQ